MPDDEARPLVTITGGPVDLLQADVLDTEDRAGVLDRARSVLRWQPRRDVLLPLTAAAAALLLAGSASAVALELRRPSTDVADVVAATLEARSYRVVVESDGLAVQGGSLQLDVDLDREAFHFEVMTTSPGGDAVTFEVVTIGDDTWTRFPSAEALAGAELGVPSEESSWLRSNTDEQGDDLLGTEAGLRALLDDARVVRALPDGTVEGEDVQRVLLDIADPSEEDSSGPDEPADVLGSDTGAGVDGGDGVRAEMSVDDDGRLRQLVVTESDGDDSVTSTVVLSRFGEEPDIEPPPADQVRDGSSSFGS